MTRKRPTVPPMSTLFGNQSTPADDPAALYELLVDQAREAMVVPDPLRGSTAASSVKVATALLVRADAVRP